MKQLLNVYKPKGLTPLEVIHLVRKNFPEYKNEKIGYAGRLDPLAHGVLLLMIGEETNKQREQYLYLPKEYEFEVVFGVATDTYDALGLITNTNLETTFAGSKEKLKQFIQSKIGKQNQPYPPFSSKTVNGKPLFWYAKENKLSEIEIPVKEIEIYDLKLISTKQIKNAAFKKEVMQQIVSVEGDFRQDEIIKTWNAFFEKNKQETFETARFTLSCSSGTYVRSLVSQLGQQLGTGAITLEILRTKVGEYTVENATKLS